MSERDYQPCRTSCSGEQLLCQRETTNLAGLLIVGSSCYVKERLPTLQGESETANLAGLLVVGSSCYVRARLPTLQDCL